MASELKLEGTFTEGKKVLWSGKHAKQWQKALKEDRIIAGDGLRELITSSGRRLSAFPDSPSAGDMVYYDGSDWVLLPAGQQGSILYATGSGIAWLAPASGGLNVLTTQGTDPEWSETEGCE